MKRYDVLLHEFIRRYDMKRYENTATHKKIHLIDEFAGTVLSKRR